MNSAIDLLNSAAALPAPLHMSGGYVTRSGNNLLFAADSGNQVLLYENSVWTPHTIPDAGVTTSCTALPFAGDCYVYVYDVSGVLTLEISTTAPTTQNGIQVKTGDASRLLVARAFAWPTDITTTGQAISSGDYSAAYAKAGAFDNVELWSGSVNTTWGSSQTGSGVSGVAYIGQDFGSGVAKNIRAVRFLNAGATYEITSAKVQYSDNGSTWFDATTAALNTGSYAQTWISVPDSGTHRYWRLLANANSTNIWIVTELEFGEGSEILVYGSTYNAATDYSKHMLCNVYNKRTVELYKNPPSGTWSYTTATWRPWNYDCNCRVQFISDGKESVNTLIQQVGWNNSAYYIAVGVGVDTTTVNSANFYGMVTPSDRQSHVTAAYRAVLAAGYHYLQALEWSAAAGTTTWVGLSLPDTKNGILATIQA